MTYAIEKNRPIPASASLYGTGHRTKYPFADMAVGDSFVVPRPMPTSTLESASQRHGCRFRAAPEGDGSRVWRIA